MLKPIASLWLGLFAAVLTGCVTVTDGGRPKVDKKQVLESNIRLGMTYLQQDQRDNALRSFTKALEIDRRSAEAHQGMAMIHQINGEFDMAEKNYKKALRSRADFSRADIEFTYGLFLKERERCDEASKYFESASRDIAYRRRVNALYELGLCVDGMGQSDRAMAYYNHALNINRRFAPAALELAHKQFANKDYAEAKRYLDQFAANSRQIPRSLLLGIRIERVFGNKDKEASYALALKNLHPYSREYLEYKQMIESEQ